MNKAIYRILMVLCLSFLFQIFQDSKGWISYAGEPPKEGAKDAGASEFFEGKVTIKTK